MNPNADEQFIEEVFDSDPQEPLLSDKEVKHRYQHLIDHLVEKAEEVWPPKPKGILKLSKDWIIHLWDFMTLVDTPLPAKRAATRGSATTGTESDDPESIPKIQVTGNQCTATLSIHPQGEDSLDIEVSVKDEKGKAVQPLLVTLIKQNDTILFNKEAHSSHQVALKGLSKTEYHLTLSGVEGKRSVSIPIRLAKPS